MKKQIYIIWDDICHPKEVIKPALDILFMGDNWDMITTSRARDILPKEIKPDLVIFFTNGRPDGEADLSSEEQKMITTKVLDGMGILFYHAGLVLIEQDSPFYLQLNSGRFVRHPEQEQVTMTPVGGMNHSILEGVESFTEKDEHYFCQVDVSRTNLLMCSTSSNLTGVGAWAHEYGKGHVVGIAQGHTTQMLCNGNMLKLASNAITWCLG